MVRGVLLARLTLRDGFGNVRRMDVRRAENDELVLGMVGGGSVDDVFLAALEPPPAFCAPGNDRLTVVHAAGCVPGTWKVERIEYGPTARLSGG